jgi:hypothetical protein
MMPACWFDGCKACDDAQWEVQKVKRPNVNEDGGVSLPIRVDAPKMLVKLPQVAELLAQPAWDDGVVKGERCLFLFLDGVTVRLLVKVGTPPLKLSVVGRGWDEAFAALEATLRSEDIPWQQDDKPAGGGAKKKK